MQASRLCWKRRRKTAGLAGRTALPPGGSSCVSTGVCWCRNRVAARSEGIRAGDVVVAVNDRPVTRVEDFRAALAQLPPGRPVALLDDARAAADLCAGAHRGAISPAPLTGYAAPSDQKPRVYTYHR